MAESKHLPKVLLLGPPNVFEVHGKHFSQRFQFLKPFESPIPTDQFLAENCGSVRAMMCSGETPVTSDLLGKLPAVRIIVTSSAGVNHIDLTECRRRGISVCNAGTVFSEDVADTAVGLVIDVMRRISAGDRFVRSGVWPVQGQYPLGSKVIIHHLSPYYYYYFFCLEFFYTNIKERNQISYHIIWVSLLHLSSFTSIFVRRSGVYLDFNLSIFD